MNIFQEATGDWSLRRVLAALSFVLACAAGMLAIIFKLDWKIVAIAFGVPIGASLILLFFTTWADIKGFAEVIKKGQ